MYNQLQGWCTYGQRALTLVAGAVQRHNVDHFTSRAAKGNGISCDTKCNIEIQNHQPLWPMVETALSVPDSPQTGGIPTEWSCNSLNTAQLRGLAAITQNDSAGSKTHRSSHQRCR